MNEPYWYLLLRAWTEKLENSGLTVPFLIGAQTLISKSVSIDERSIGNLFNEIFETECSNRIVTIDYCTTIQEYVLGLCSAQEASQLPGYYNQLKRPSLVILNNSFGSHIFKKMLVEQMEEMYLEVVLAGSFSKANSAFGKWQPYSEADKHFILDCVAKSNP